jgi:hypothetical protein
MTAVQMVDLLGCSAEKSALMLAARKASNWAFLTVVKKGDPLVETMGPLAEMLAAHSADLLGNCTQNCRNRWN